MQEYRAYTVGDDDHFISYRAFVCTNDEDAIIWAEQLLDGRPIELWSGNRLVRRLDRNSE
jgi:hypothetical protein